LDEISGDLEVDIRVQQGIPYFPGRLFEMALGDTSLTAKVPEDFLQPI
jgi:hypothetical protein